jgi:tetratricopeptide (TPR) repeat protein
MTRIALRTYQREIESWIAAGQSPLAITHCRHILHIFPKNIATYRLAGRAYLENHQYNEAADTYLRLLSSVPDDLPAHLGLAVIREGEGQLDSASWHLERAFEIEPASQTLKQELTRLTALRQGGFAASVQLSRAALARMYARGGLLPQVIAELRLAVADEPNRMDLQVMLAHYLEASGRLDEAVPICHTVLQLLPYCLDANQIMTTAAVAAGRNPEAELYFRRLVELDPYFQHTPFDQLAPDLAPDQSVSLEKLI